MDLGKKKKERREKKKRNFDAYFLHLQWFFPFFSLGILDFFPQYLQKSVIIFISF